MASPSHCLVFLAIQFGAAALHLIHRQSPDKIYTILIPKVSSEEGFTSFLEMPSDSAITASGDTTTQQILFRILIVNST